MYHSKAAHQYLIHQTISWEVLSELATAAYHLGIWCPLSSSGGVVSYAYTCFMTPYFYRKYLKSTTFKSPDLSEEDCFCAAEVCYILHIERIILQMFKLALAITNSWTLQSPP